MPFSSIGDVLVDHKEDETTLARMVIATSEGGTGKGYEGHLVLDT